MMTETKVSANPDPMNQNSISFKEREKELEAIRKLEQEQHKREQKNSQNSPYTNWAQFNLDKNREIMWLSLKFPKAATLLYFFVEEMDHYNAVICSSKVIEEKFEMSRQTVSKYIGVLKTHGFIHILRTGGANIYTVNHNIFWKSYGKNIKHSKFPANIIITLSEQDKNEQMSLFDTPLTTVKQKEIKLKNKSKQEVSDAQTTQKHTDTVFDV